MPRRDPLPIVSVFRYKAHDIVPSRIPRHLLTSNPGPWQKIDELRCRMTWKAAEDVTEVGERVSAIPLRTADQAEQNSRGLTAKIAAGE